MSREWPGKVVGGGGNSGEGGEGGRRVEGEGRNKG